MMLLWSLRAAAVIVLGLLLTGILRRRSAAVRSVALRATLLAVWALPFAALIAPRLEVALPQPPPAAAPAIQPIPETPAPTFESAITTDEPAMSASAPVTQSTVETPPTPKEPFDPRPWLVGGYVAVAALLVARWLVGYARLRRIARTALPLEADVRRTADLTVPATFGTLRPQILLPLASADWPEARVRAAVLHERAHVRRRDWAWQTLASLFAALHWINPFAWLLSRVLRDTAEAAADDEALAQMAPSEYARELLAVAATATPAGPALAMARRGGVRDRVVAVLAAGRDRRAPSRRVGGLLFAALASVGLGFAGLAAKGQAAKEESADVVSAPTSVGPFNLPNGNLVELVEVRETGKETSLAWDPRGDSGVWTVPNPGYAATTEPSWRSLELIVRTLGSTDEGLSSRLETHPKLRLVASGGETRVESVFRENLLNFRVEVPKETPQQDFRIGFSSGRYVPEPKTNAFTARVSQMDLKENGRRLPMIEVKLPFPTRFLDRDVRLSAFDAQGRRLTLKHWGSQPAMNNGVREATNTYNFLGTDPRRIAFVRYETRPLAWITFKGVHLTVPSQKAPGPATLADVSAPDKSDRTAAWDAAGHPLGGVESAPNSGWEIKPSERMVQVRFHTSSTDSSLPSVRVRVPPTAHLLAYGPVIERPGLGMVLLRVPKSLRTVDLDAGFATGLWRRYEGALEEPKRVPPLGTNRRGLAVAVPQALRQEAFELRAYAGAKRLEPLASETGSKEGYARLIFKGDAPKATRFELWHRPYRWQSFANVPLYPKSTVPFEIDSLVGRAPDGKLVRWTPEGKKLPMDARRPIGQGESLPTQRLSTLFFKASGHPSFEFDFASPSASFASIYDPKTRLGQVSFVSPKSSVHSDLRVGMADGPWLRYMGKIASRPVTNPSPYIRSVGHGLTVTVPPAFRREAVEVQVYLRNQRDPETASFTNADGSEKTVAFKPSPDQIERIELRHRPYRWLAFKGLPLIPPGSPAPTQAYGPVRLADGYSVEVENVVQDVPGGHRTWLPDGTPAADPWPDMPQITASPGAKAERPVVSYGLHLWGPPIADGRVRYRLDGEAWQERRLDPEPATAAERTIYPALAFRRGRTLGALELELRLGPWRTEADLPVAKGKAVVDPSVDQLGGEPYRYTYLTFPGAPNVPIPGRITEVKLYDRAGRPIPTMPNADPGPRRGRYFVGVEHPERIARVVLRSRTQQTVRFRKLHLAPRP